MGFWRVEQASVMYDVTRICQRFCVFPYRNRKIRRTASSATLNNGDEHNDFNTDNALLWHSWSHIWARAESPDKPSVLNFNLSERRAYVVSTTVAVVLVTFP